MNPTLISAEKSETEYMVFAGGILMGHYDAYLSEIVRDCRDRAEMIAQEFNII